MATELKTIPASVEPFVAFGRFRAHLPDRSCVLFERVPGPRSPAGPQGGAPVSIVGYLARSEEVHPPGAPVLRELAAASAALPHDAAPEHDAVEAFAARLSWAAFGLLSFDATLRGPGVAPWPDEEHSGRFMTNLTVGVWDHANGRIVIAGRTKNACERFAWEATHPKGDDPLLPEADAVPNEPPRDLAFTVPERDEAKLLQKLAVRLDMLSLPGAHVHVPRHAPAPGADPLDAYLALRALGGPEGLWAVAFGTSPMAAPVAHVGRSEGFARADEGGAWLDELAAALPLSARVGGSEADRVRLTKLLRDLEPVARGPYGGLAGFTLPGGGGLFAHVGEVLTLAGGNLWLGAGVDVGANATSLRDRLGKSPLARAARWAQHRGSQGRNS